ncbi:hypothetical protein ACQ7HM_06595 [Williamsia sp. MIQD14]|uniref:hypothetical protein n=1 Tax=Williamsia sp. MIQD14 TaxID=3425703 RepID=UPI003DA0ABF1
MSASMSPMPRWVPVLLGVVTVSAIVGGAVFAVGAPSRPIAAPQAADPRPEKVQSARDSLSEAKLLFGFLTAAVSGGSATVTTLTDGVGQIFDAVDTAGRGSQQLVSALEQAPSLAAAGGQVSQLTARASGALGEVSRLSDAAAPVDALVDRIVAAVESNAIPGARSSLPALRSLQKATGDLTSQSSAIAGLQRALAGLGPAARSSAGTVDASISSARASADQLSEGFATLSAARPRVVEAADSFTKTFGQLTTVLQTIDSRIGAAQADLGPNAAITPPESVRQTQVVLARDNAPLVARSLLWAGVAGLITLVVLGGVPTVLGYRSRRRAKVVATTEA